jgi:hypothetical protein
MITGWLAAKISSATYAGSGSLLAAIAPASLDT